MTAAYGADAAPDDGLDDIAVVGMAGQFPGAGDLDAFWANLSNGVESVREFDADELAALGVPGELVGHPDFVPFGAILDDPAAFDHGFWGYSPREAALIDPQQRLFLQTAWHALEHAGYDPLRYPGMIGVFAGMGLSTYLLFNLAGNPAVGEGDTPLVMLGNDKDFLTTRTSYHLDLRGPSLAVQTGCSSSLVATHLACESLFGYQCDMAVVGGSAVAVPQRTGHLHVANGTASPDGHTRAFDADAAGTVFGSGVGAVVLKRLADARADGDTVYALIRGSAINNDGGKKIGFTAPRIDGQADVVLRAQRVAGVDPRSVSYVETHGTATSIGDPMEIAGLTKAFRHGTPESGFCAVGSVKTNIGHLDTAAGVAGLIKTVLALQHRRIPPSLNFDRPNSLIDFAQTPFFVAAEARNWPAGEQPRRAGVSAFGFGGTNAHVVVEEAPAEPPRPVDERSQVLVLSARTPRALEDVSTNLADFLDRAPDVDLGDVAHTLQQGRAVLPHRRAVLVRDRADAAAVLRAAGPRVHGGVRADQGRGVAFLLPGLGDQYRGMGHDLYAGEPVYRAALDHCADVLRRRLGVDLLAALHLDTLHADGGTPPGDAAGLDLRAMLGRGNAVPSIEPRALVHPAIFAVGWSLAQQWLAWGVRPSALLGHSTGEWVAATLAGVFDVDDAITLVARRSRLIDTLPTGAMLAVPLGAGQTAAEIAAEIDAGRDTGLAVALVNSPELTVVSGTEPAVDALAARLERWGLATRRIASSHAYHTPALRPIIGDLVAEVAAVPRSAPTVPFLSNVTGTWITADQASDPEYWGLHTESTVQFAPGLAELCRDRDHVLLEVGPGQSLSSLAQAHLTATETPGDGERVLASMRAGYDRRLDDRDLLRDVLARLWIAGVEPDWDAVHEPYRARRIALPGYPFARDRAWIAPAQPSDVAASAAAGVGRATARGVQDSWLLAPGWRSLPAPPPRLAPDGDGSPRWTVFCDGSELSRRLRERLALDGVEVVVVEAGAVGCDFEPTGHGFRLDPAAPEHYSVLLDRLAAEDATPSTIVHLWSRRPSANGMDDELRDGFYSLGYLGRALGARRDAKTRLCVLTDGVAAVDSADQLNPARATVLAPAKVIPQEYEGVTVHVLDVGGGELGDDTVTTILDTVAEQPVDRLVAVRGRRRWVRDHTPARLDRPVRPLREGAVVVLLGGLGMIGLRLAEHLATTVGARLVVAGRSADPAIGSDDDAADTVGADAVHTDGAGTDLLGTTSARIRRLRQAGVEVRVHHADAADADDLRRVLAATAEEFGDIDAVVHAAGIGGAAAFGLLDEVGPELSEPQFAAKVRSAAVLAEVLAEGPWRPGSVLLMSSNAALLGGLGGATYTAGNIFVDTLAEAGGSGAHRSDAHWVSVNLEEWLPDGGGTAIGYETSFSRYAIRADEGVQILKRALECATDGRVGVVTADLEQRVQRWLKQPSASRRTSVPGIELAPRPDLTAAFAAPKGEVETATAEVWSEVLGIAGIGRDDNFHELGGHSLLATQIVTRLNAVLPVRLSLLNLFRSPTVAGLGAEAAALDTRTAEAAAADQPVRPTLRAEHLPASFAQRRFWFLDQLAPGSAFYTILDAVRISGPLDVDNLRTALETIVARHEALRTTLRVVDAEPVQVILPPEDVELPFTTIELDVGPGEELEQTLGELTEKQLQVPFDLANGPLMRACVARLGPDDHVLLLSSHHSVSDAWSTGIIVRELAKIYPAVREGRPARLDPPELHYADFAAWQRDRLAGDRLDQLLEHWQAVMDGAPERLELPTDRPRPAVQSFRGAVHPVTLPAPLLDRVRALAAANDCTLFMALLSAFTAVLYLQSGQRDIVVGSPIAGRVRPEFEEIVGTFVNMLALRTRIEPDETVADLLARVRRSTLDAFDHQFLPFELLVEALSPERDLSHSPVFQVSLVLQNAPLPDLRMGDLELTPLAVPTTTARFDLMLMLRETEDGAVGMIEYSTDLFDVETVVRLEHALLAVLEQVTDGPERVVGTLELVSPEDRHRLLADPAPPPGDDLDLLASIDAMVRARPDAPALLDADGRATSFAELDRRAERAARRLRAAGVGPGARVGLHLERDADAITILLGVLRLGAVYVPLDPAYPADRLAFMVKDSGSTLVVSETDELPFASPGVTALPRLACVDGIATPATPDDGSATVHPAPDDVAFVIYTSGSTGGPKGVLGTHGGMLNRLRWMWDRYPFAPGEMCCQKTSLNFLDSFWEIFGPLARGVPVVVTPHAVVQDPSRLVDVLAGAGVTRLVVVPSLLGALLDTVPDLDHRLGRLRTWVTSGEALPPALVSRFHDLLPDRTLLNLYGASEVSADVTAHEVGPADAQLSAVPIGRPIAGVRVLLLDERMRLTPDGADGDVYVGGVALAHGYAGRPGLTADAFVPDPFAPQPGARLYRTGDRARRRPDGVLEYRGRRDDQVKVRGHRVELAEVEQALLRHRAIAAAVTTVQGGSLAAYAVVAPGLPAPNPAELREHLLGLLPAYAVPSAYVFLDALPMTPSGKLDRRALPVPGAAARPGTTAALAPRDDVERVLAGLWNAVLGSAGGTGQGNGGGDTNGTDVMANFFTVGGHSLLATRLIARVNESFGSDVGLHAVFEDPTIAGLAGALRASGLGAAEIERRAQMLIAISELSDEQIGAMLAGTGDEPR